MPEQPPQPPTNEVATLPPPVPEERIKALGSGAIQWSQLSDTEKELHVYFDNHCSDIPFGD